LPWLAFLSAADRQTCVHEIARAAAGAMASGKVKFLTDTLYAWEATGLAAWDAHNRQGDTRYDAEEPVPLKRPSWRSLPFARPPDKLPESPRVPRPSPRTAYKVVAKNRQVHRDWEDMLRTHPDPALRCWDHISNQPATAIGERMGRRIRTPTPLIRSPPRDDVR